MPGPAKEGIGFVGMGYGGLLAKVVVKLWQVNHLEISCWKKSFPLAGVSTYGEYSHL